MQAYCYSLRSKNEPDFGSPRPNVGEGSRGEGAPHDWIFASVRRPSSKPGFENYSAERASGRSYAPVTHVVPIPVVSVCRKLAVRSCSERSRRLA